MAKKIKQQIKLQIMAGKATPAPPVGPALGQAGVAIMDFCKAFNAKTATKELEGLIVPVVITVYQDRSYTFVTKTPPAAVLIKKAANLAKGSGEPNRTKVGAITGKQVEQIAKEILKLTGSPSRIVHRPLPEDDPKVRQPDISRARTLLGWEPKVSLEEGLRNTLAYFRAKLHA